MKFRTASEDSFLEGMVTKKQRLKRVIFSLLKACSKRRATAVSNSNEIGSAVARR